MTRKIFTFRIASFLLQEATDKSFYDGDEELLCYQPSQLCSVAMQGHNLETLGQVPTMT